MNKDVRCAQNNKTSFHKTNIFTATQHKLNKQILNMKIAIVASLIASAAAFAPAKHATTNTALSAFENELGAQKPLGFYDPLNLVADGDEEKFERLRYTELVRD